MDRRTFLAGTAAAAVATGARVPVAAAKADWSALDLTGQQPDANGVIVPKGFRARVIARSQEVVEGTDYSWPVFPDGGAVFPADDGGWVYVANSEVPNGAGGASALRFDRDGEITDAYRILEGTSTNCAGGATPWGTWLSGEEYDGLTVPELAEAGFIWECDPMRPGQGEPRPAMGAFQHEAAAVHDDREEVYLTEDQADGRFYRFTPARYPDLSEGRLDVAVVDGRQVRWERIADPSGKEAGPLRYQVADATVFTGGEGIVIRDGIVFFSTKLDNKVWRYDPEAGTISALYDLERDKGVLSGVDNLTVAPTGELVVAEDGGNMEVVIVADDGRTQPIFRIVGEDGSELTGPAFDASGTRMYVSSQRGGPLGSGVTFEVTGPFQPEPEPEPTTTTTSTTSTTAAETTTTAAPTDGDDGETAAPSADSDDGGTSWALPAVAGGAAVLLGAAAVWRVRTRGGDSDADSDGPQES